MTDFPFEIVGFDLDGTLLDTHGDIGTALNHAMATIDRPAFAMSEVASMVGGGTRTLLTNALDRTGGHDGVDFEALNTALVEYYADNIAEHSRLFPGGEAALDLLAGRGVKLALVTNKLERLAVKLLSELGLASCFAIILGGDSLGPGRSKPSPDLLTAMTTRLGGGAAAYVGDTTYDTRAARAAGMPCACFTGGYLDAPAADLGADALFDHFDHLVPTLQALGKP